MCWHFQDGFEGMHSEISSIFLFLPRYEVESLQPFYQLSNVSFMRATFSLFFHNRMCLNRTVFTIYIFDLNMHWFKPDCVSRDSDKHYSTICARTDCCLCVSMLWHISIVTYLLQTLCRLVIITINVILHLKKKKTASLSNEHKMSDSRSLLIWIIDNVSPILPSSVLECCLEFLHFWEHTHSQRNLLPTYE